MIAGTQLVAFGRLDAFFEPADGFAVGGVVPFKGTAHVGHGLAVLHNVPQPVELPFLGLDLFAQHRQRVRIAPGDADQRGQHHRSQRDGDLEPVHSQQTSQALGEDDGVGGALVVVTTRATNLDIGDPV